MVHPNTPLAIFDAMTLSRIRTHHLLVITMGYFRYDLGYQLQSKKYTANSTRRNSEKKPGFQFTRFMALVNTICAWSIRKLVSIIHVWTEYILGPTSNGTVLFYFTRDEDRDHRSIVR